MVSLYLLNAALHNHRNYTTPVLSLLNWLVYGLYPLYFWLLLILGPNRNWFNYEPLVRLLHVTTFTFYRQMRDFARR